MNKVQTKRKSILKQGSISFQPPDLSQLTLDNNNHISNHHLNNHVKIDADKATVIVVEEGSNEPKNFQQEEAKNQQLQNCANQEQSLDVSESKRVSNKYPTMKEADLIKLALSNPKIWEDDEENDEQK